jgi:predicted nucleic acid-binding protein
VARVIVLDANVLIGFLDATDPHHHAALDLLERHFADGFAASVLTVAEAVVHRTRVDKQDAATTALTKIGLQVLALESTEAKALATVRNRFRIRMPDAVALHTALSTGSALATFDEALGRAATQAGVILAT